MLLFLEESTSGFFSSCSQPSYTALFLFSKFNFCVKSTNLITRSIFSLLKAVCRADFMKMQRETDLQSGFPWLLSSNIHGGIF